MATIDDLKKTRLNKLESLKKEGLDPYPGFITREQSVREARAMEGKAVSVAGRIMGMRGHGKIFFLDLVDGTDKIQVVLKSDACKPEAFSLTSYMDLGDFLAVQGNVGQTQAGEVSVFATDFQLISKAVRPLPSEWSGLKDIEERYRQRYVDLVVNPDVREIFITRSRVITFLRKFLDADGFLEVDTPVLQPIYGGAQAKPFITHHNALDVDLFLRISDELYLKRLIVGGFDKVYEIGRDFRNEGIDRQHNPEFTMLEFYWAYANYDILMQYTETMLSRLVKELKGSYKLTYQGETFDFTPPWPRETYRDVVIKYSGIDINAANTEKKLLAAVKDKRIKLDLTGVVGYGALLDTLYKATARPHLTGPMYLTDRPTAFVALAKRRPDDPTKTASFQLLVAGKEIINAYNELNDPADQAARWHESEDLGKKGQSEHEAFDDDYIRALEYGMPPTAGWGMGIDRLVTVLTDQPNLKDVILFPTLRPETKAEKANDEARIQETEKEEKQTAEQSKNHDLGISYKDAEKLLDANIKDPITKMHMRESEAIMRQLAKHFGENEEAWGILGLLHDIDWELTKDDTKEHCIKCVDILKKAGGSEYLISTIQSHGYGQGFGEEYYGPAAFKGKTREGRVQHALAAAETSTGLIIATALVQPDKKLASVKPESLLKKFNNKKFAANCRREIISECEQIGIPIAEFLGMGLKALQDIHETLGL